MPIICQIYGSYTELLAREGGGPSERDAFSHHSKEGGTHTEVSFQKHLPLVHLELYVGRMGCMDGMGWTVIIGHWSSKRTFSAIMDVLCPLSFIFSF